MPELLQRGVQIRRGDLAVELEPCRVDRVVGVHRH